MARGLRFTPEQAQALQGGRAEPGSSLAPSARPRKYRNQPVSFDGQRWDSRWEYECWLRLRLRERAGEIYCLQRQVPFRLAVKAQVVGCLIVDFTFRDANGIPHAVDAKSAPTRTPLFRWKAKHFKAEYGFDIELMERP